MKLLFCLLLAVLSVDGREVTGDQLEARESQIQESEEEIISDGLNLALERRVCARPTISCVLAGGGCINSGGACEGTIDPSGCRGRQCHCCIPPRTECKGCSEGFFSVNGSSRCFKMFTDKYRIWSDAKDKCIDEGLILPSHTDDIAIALRQTIYEIGILDPDIYGGVNVWLDARVEGGAYKWQNDGSVISIDNPLWLAISNTPNSMHCVLLATTGISRPDKPYSFGPCTYHLYTLCEAE